MRELGYALFFLGCSCLIVGLTVLSGAVVGPPSLLLQLATLPVLAALAVGYARFMRCRAGRAR